MSLGCRRGLWARDTHLRAIGIKMAPKTVRSPREGCSKDGPWGAPTLEEGQRVGRD